MAIPPAQFDQSSILIRRREAAELARALQLSTQQAQTISKASPQFFSSSDTSGATQESKEMELRPVNPTEDSATQEVFPLRPDMSGEIMPPPNLVPATVETIEAEASSGAKQFSMFLGSSAKLRNVIII